MASTSPRLLRQLTDSSDGPLRRTHDGNMRSLSDSIIGPEHLIKVTNGADLDMLVHLSIVVDTRWQSLLEIGSLLPCLQSLILDGSIITSIRDLGTVLVNLQSLSLNECDLSDIDGISALSGLKQLSLRDNNIADCDPLAMHPNIEELILCGNQVRNFSVTNALASCDRLKRLYLSRNPIESAPHYRLVIPHFLPGLQSLDGTPINSSAAKRVNDGMLEEAQAYVRMQAEDLEDQARLELEMVDTDDPTWKSAKADAPYRALMTFAAVDVVDTSCASAEEPGGVGSELTHGSSVVLAGNMATAIRRRRAEQQQSKAHAQAHAQDGRVVVSSASCPKLPDGDCLYGQVSFPSKFSAPFSPPTPHDGDKKSPPRPAVLRISPEHSLESADNRRPKSALSSSIRENSSGVQGFDYLNLHGLGSGKQSAVDRSPRQRNSSRPQSAAPLSARSGDSGGLVPSAPFKVRAPGADGHLTPSRGNRSDCQLVHGDDPELSPEGYLENNTRVAPRGKHRKSNGYV